MQSTGAQQYFSLVTSQFLELLLLYNRIETNSVRPTTNESRTTSKLKFDDKKQIYSRINTYLRHCRFLQYQFARLLGLELYHSLNPNMNKKIKMYYLLKQPK